MSDEKNLFENEEAVEAAQEAVEEVVEAAEEVVEEAVEVAEEVIEDAEEVIDEAPVAFEEADEEAVEEVAEASEDEEKKVYTRVSLIKAVIITLVICGILMVAEYYFMDSRINHYNLNEDGYATTLDDAAKQMDKTLDEFKKENGLPEDMPGDTTISIAEGYIKLGKMLEMQGMGEDMIPMFAQMYGIDESKLSKDMYMGEFNKLVMEASLKASQEAEKAPAEDEALPAEGEEAPAEGEAAPAEGEEAPKAE